jgi:riboflavin synthase
VFTGIVEETGTVIEPGARLRVRASSVASDAAPGDSIAVSGVCLTVVTDEDAAHEGAERQGVLAFDLSDETLARTTLGGLSSGDRVNLERPVVAGGALGGHLVQGHVDGVGVIDAAEDALVGREVRITAPPDLRRFVAEKGSITVDGVSLTVTGIEDGTFGVALIPFTLEVTTLGERAPGDRVNLEVDVVARYIGRLLEERR